MRLGCSTEREQEVVDFERYIFSVAYSAEIEDNCPDRECVHTVLLLEVRKSEAEVLLYSETMELYRIGEKALVKKMPARRLGEIFSCYRVIKASVENIGN